MAAPLQLWAGFLEAFSLPSADSDDASFTLFPDELEGVVIDLRNGDDRQNTWEVAQILALTEDMFFAYLRNEA